jgi:hypothetical protein
MVDLFEAESASRLDEIATELAGFSRLKPGPHFRLSPGMETALQAPHG